MCVKASSSPSARMPLIPVRFRLTKFARGGYNDFNDVSHREARFTPVQAKCRPAAQTESKQQQKGKMDVKSNGFSSRRAARASE